MKTGYSILVLVYMIMAQTITATAQTVHLHEGKIEYKGTVKLEELKKEDLYNRARQALSTTVKIADHAQLKEDRDSGELKTKGEIRLASVYSIIRTVHYTISLSVEDGKYKYRIDDVFIREKVRGGKTTDTPSEDLVKGMDTSGPVSIKTEEQLNEIDMDFQQLLDEIRNKMGESTASR